MTETMSVVLELGRWGLVGGLAYVALWAATRPRQENTVWRELGIRNAKGEYPHLLDKRTTGSGITYTFYIPDGVDMSKFKSDRGDGKAGKQHAVVAQAFAGQRQCDIVPLGSNKMAIRVYERHLGKQYEFDPELLPKRKLLEIPIGQSLRGVEHIHLGDSSAHIGIAGTTGSGKSTATRVIVTWLAAHREPCELHLVDLKGGVELGMYANCRKVNGFAKTEAEARAMIAALVAEMGRRYDLLAAAGVNNIADYPRKLRRVVLVVDEFADLSGSREITEHLVEIARKGRAAGVHMVIATQRPDAATIDGRLKANIVTWLCFRVKLPVNSVVILGHGGAESLRGAGHGILDRGDRETEIQGYIMPDDMIKRLIAPTIIQKPKPEQADTSGVLQ